jgi:hypothetical protein
MGNLAEHARTERAKAHGVDDITDGYAGAQVERAQFFELDTLHSFSTVEGVCGS